MRLDEIWEVIISILLAVLGGLARLLNVKDERTLKLSRMLSELLIAAFIGSMSFLLAKEMHTESKYLMWLLAGSAGWVGPKILNLITPVLGKFNIDIKEPADEEQKQQGKPL